MRGLVFAGMLATLGVLLPQSGWAADTWCARNFGDSPDKPCASAPLDYCLRGIRLGGVCARDRGYLQDSDSRDRVQKPSRRAGAKDRSDW
jgi:hypothetical protein